MVDRLEKFPLSFSILALSLGIPLGITFILYKVFSVLSIYHFIGAFYGLLVLVSAITVFLLCETIGGLVLSRKKKVI